MFLLRRVESADEGFVVRMGQGLLEADRQLTGITQEQGYLGRQGGAHDRTWREMSRGWREGARAASRALSMSWAWRVCRASSRVMLGGTAPSGAVSMPPGRLSTPKFRLAARPAGLAPA